MENTLSSVIFEPTEADYEFVDAMVEGLDAFCRVPSADELPSRSVNLC